MDHCIDCGAPLPDAECERCGEPCCQEHIDSHFRGSTMTTMSEKWVQTKIRDLLTCRGIETEKIWGNAINYGFPDLFCGRFWIEVKAPGKKLRPDQVEWFELWVDRMGAAAYVVDDHRKLWLIISDDGTCTGKAGGAKSNWKEFAPKKKHSLKLESALKAFGATRP